MNNQMELIFPSLAENEAFARMVISAFLVGINPTLSVVSEIRTAVSEAVTNAVVHAYAGTVGKMILRARLTQGRIEIEIEDFGRGIEDVAQAMQPFFTTEPDEERTGMGFTLMQSFMDEVSVESSPGHGTVVRMARQLEDAHA